VAGVSLIESIMTQHISLPALLAVVGTSGVIITAILAQVLPFDVLSFWLGNLLTLLIVYHRSIWQRLTAAWIVRWDTRAQRRRRGQARWGQRPWTGKRWGRDLELTDAERVAFEEAIKERLEQP
jgi:hypothetical protein